MISVFSVLWPGDAFSGEPYRVAGTIGGKENVLERSSSVVGNFFCTGKKVAENLLELRLNIEAETELARLIGEVVSAVPESRRLVGLPRVLREAAWLHCLLESSDGLMPGEEQLRHGVRQAAFALRVERVFDLDLNAIKGLRQNHSRLLPDGLSA